MTVEPDPFAHSDAAYVMGALAPAERREYEAHRATCRRCAAAVAELSGLPGLLGLVQPDQVTAVAQDPGPVPDTLMPRLAARVRRDRRRRTLVAVTGGLAAAACLVVGLVLAGVGGDHPRGTVTTLVPVRPVPVRATVRLQPVSWGTRVEVRCTYTGTVAPVPGTARATYRLVAVPAGGGPAVQLADWRTLPDQEVTATGSTALTVNQLGTLQLEAGDGTVLLAGAP